MPAVDGHGGLVLESSVGVVRDLIVAPRGPVRVVPGQLVAADAAVEVVEVDAGVVHDATGVDGQPGVTGRVVRTLRKQVQRPVVRPGLGVAGDVIAQVGVAVVGVVVVRPGHVRRAVARDPGLVHWPSGAGAVRHEVRLAEVDRTRGRRPTRSPPRQPGRRLGDPGHVSRSADGGGGRAGRSRRTAGDHGAQQQCGGEADSHGSEAHVDPLSDRPVQEVERYQTRDVQAAYTMASWAFPPKRLSRRRTSVQIGCGSVVTTAIPL